MPSFLDDVVAKYFKLGKLDNTTTYSMESRLALFKSQIAAAAPIPRVLIAGTISP